MEQGLQIFNHARFGQIRAVEIDGEPWFYGKDVADALGYSNSRDALAKHVDAEDKNTVAKRDGSAGNQNVTVINESGLYALIVSSKLPDAKKFKRWVTHDVLPTIRKTGGYVSNEDLFLNTYLPYADDGTKKLFSATLSALRAANQKIEADRPKVLFADAVSVTKSDITVGELSKLLKQNGINVGRNRLFEILRSNGFLIREKGKDRSLPTQRSMELGLFRVKESTIHANGEVLLSRTPYVTGKGITYFIDKFLNGALRA